MSLDIVKDSTDVIMYVVIRDSVTGVLETGFDVTVLDFQYTRTGAEPSTKQDVTALAATNSDHADNKAIEIDGTNSPGLCRVDFPNAAFAAGVNSVRLSVTGAGFDISPKEIPLIDAPATAEAQAAAHSTTDGKVDAVKGVVDAIPTTAMRGTDGANTTTPPTVTEIQAEMEENEASILDDIKDVLPETKMAAASDIPAMVGTDDAAKATALTTHDNKLAPVALDGGTATIGGMLTKMADDSGGAGFDATDDSLQAIGDKVHTQGAGAIEWTYTVTSSVAPYDTIADVDVWVTGNIDGTNVLASERTDASGEVTFFLDAGTVYVWKQKSGLNDDDSPDEEVVS